MHYARLPKTIYMNNLSIKKASKSLLRALLLEVRGLFFVTVRCMHMRKHKGSGLQTRTCIIGHTPHCTKWHAWTKSLRDMVTFLLCSNIDTTGLSKQVQQRTVTLPLTLRDAWWPGPWAWCTLHTRECVLITTMFVPTAPLFWSIQSAQRVHLLCPPGNDMDYKKTVTTKKCHMHTQQCYLFTS